MNRVPAAAGGCQIRLNDGDQVLLEWQDGSKPNLQLTAPASAQVGQRVDVGVQQYGGDGVLAPAAGASVAGQLTGGDGHATVTFTSAGVQHLKATRGTPCARTTRTCACTCRAAATATRLRARR